MPPMRLEEKTLNKHKSIQHNLDFKLGPYLPASLNPAPPVRKWCTLEGSFLLPHTSTQRKGEHIHMNLFAVYLIKSIPSDMTLNINDRISHLCEEHFFIFTWEFYCCHPVLCPGRIFDERVSSGHPSSVASILG